MSSKPREAIRPGRIWELRGKNRRGYLLSTVVPEPCECLWGWWLRAGHSRWGMRSWWLRRHVAVILPSAHTVHLISLVFEGVASQNSLVKCLQGGWGDDSVSQGWLPLGLILRTYSRQREPTPARCPLTSTHTMTECGKYHVIREEGIARCEMREWGG